MVEQAGSASQDHHEIEDTYAVESDTELPALEQVPGVERVTRGGVEELEATYFDTADLTLAAVGISLRRRTGGSDAGWHLKLPMKDGRFEVHESLSRATKTVPKSLRMLLVAHTRDATLQPVAVIRTRRHVHTLFDKRWTALAEFCDDHVSAEVIGEAEPVTWREWEVELVDGDGAVLAAAATLIEDSGGRPSKSDQAGQGARRPGASRPSRCCRVRRRMARPRRWCRPGCASRST